MLAQVESRAIYGISAYRVDVEVDISSGIPSFSIVGLPDTACREASKRVLAALKNSGYQLPSRKITVNLAPAYVKKEGALYDLAIALSILAALEKIDKGLLLDKVVCGELSLDGSLRPIRGALPIADELRRNSQKILIIPYENLAEVQAVRKVNIVAARNINELMRYLVEGVVPECTDSFKKQVERPTYKNIDYADIKGNNIAKRAFEVACAGGHNILLIGPPGVGKTMMAKRLPSILDELTQDESIETSKVYSVAGLLDDERGLIKRPPFRLLHHSISDAGMIGGGPNIRPGEASLAHNGILFLDEIAEFRRDVLEALRQPLEESLIRLSRANMSILYPAKFMLVAAMNPCPCGFLTHPDKCCTCTPQQIQRYLSKISGPLLDRIDMHVEIQPVRYEQMRSLERGESSTTMRMRIRKARMIQSKRYEKENFRLNSQLPHRLINEVCQMTEEAGVLLKKAMSELFISARGYDKILKVARTVADIDGKQIIGVEEISEAIGYRSLDGRGWI